MIKHTDLLSHKKKSLTENDAKGGAHMDWYTRDFLNGIKRLILKEMPKIQFVGPPRGSKKEIPVSGVRNIF